MEQQKNGTAKIYLILLAAMVINSFYSPLVRWAAAADSNINGMNLPSYRLLVVGTCMMVLCLVNKQFRAELKTIFRDWRILLALIVMGCLRGGEMFFWSISMLKSAAFIVTILGNISPVFVVIGSYLFFKQKTPFKAMLGILLCMTGLVIVGMGGQSSGSVTPSTILLMVCSSAFGAGFLMISSKVRQKLSAIPMLAVVFLSGGIMCSLVSVGAGVYMGPFNWKGWFFILMLALVSTLMFQGIQIYISKFLKPTTISVMLLLSPVCSAITAYFVLGEALSIDVLIGGVIMLSGLAYYIVTNNRLQQGIAETAEIETE